MFCAELFFVDFGSRLKPQIRISTRLECIHTGGVKAEGF